MSRTGLGVAARRFGGAVALGWLSLGSVTLLPAQSRPRGTLFIVGGGPQPDSLVREFVALAGGPGKANIIVFAMASEDARVNGDEEAADLEKLGARARNLVITRAEAGSDSITALVAAATGIWFGGGEQTRLAAALRGTATEAMIHRRYREGAVIGGTSAGAAVMSTPMITGDELRRGGTRPPSDSSVVFITIDRDNVVTSQGLGLLNTAIIDQHFVRRRRHNRLISLVLEGPVRLGVGIDESTALVIPPAGPWRVVGASVAVIYDARNAQVTRSGVLGASGLMTHILPAGSRFDPSTGTATLPATSGPRGDGSFITADGIRIHFRVAGHGPDTVIAIHGGPGVDLESIAGDFAPLESRHVVIYYDQRGTGRSGLPDSTLLGSAWQITDLDAVREHFRLSRVTLIAHSYGPLLAATYALAHPERVRRMVFFGPLPPRRGDFWRRFGATMATRTDSTATRQLGDALKRLADPAGDPREACRAYWRLAVPPRLAEPDRTLGLVRSDFCASDPAGLRAGLLVTNRVVMASYGDWDLRIALRRLAVPTLVIHGEAESIPMDLVEEWVSSMPNARLLKVPRAAHFTHLERPEMVWPAVEQFLGRE